MRPPLLLILFAVHSLQALDLTILHNNDIHARFEETSRNSASCKQKTPPTGGRSGGCVGGFARLAHVVRRHREAARIGGKPVIYLNAGDTYVGTAWFAVHKAQICTEFMNAVPPDAASLGNHEFDFGPSVLAPFVQNATFPMLAANLDFSREPSLSAVKKSTILEINGTKVGIVGHLTEDTPLMSSPGNVIFRDVIQGVRNETEALDRAGVKIIIVLGHSGYEMDQRIAKELPLVDIVVGGHTNTFLYNGPPPDQEKPEDLYPKVIIQASGKKVPVVQAYAYTKYLGRLNVTFDNLGDLVAFQGQPILLDTDIPQDPDILDLLETFRPQISSLDREVVGTSSVLLDASDNKCRKVECNQGNMVTDAFVYYMASLYSGPGWTGTPIGLINGGGVRTTIDPRARNGSITRGEIMGSVPFENQIISLKLTGKELVETLEIGVRSDGETSKGEFLQVSGLHVLYNMSKPRFQRVVRVSARCGNCSVPVYKPVDNNEIYGIVTVSFLTNGGDDHHVLKSAKDKRVQNLGDVDTIAWYLGKLSPVYPEEQGRIEFVQMTATPNVGVKSVTVSVLALVNLLFNFFVR